MGASNDAPPLLRGWFIKINKLNMMRTNKWIYRRPTGNINKWRSSLNILNTNARPSVAQRLTLWRPQSSNWIHETVKKKKKVWILRKHVKQPWRIYVNSCTGTLSLGLALKKQSEEASNRASESLHPTANPNKPSAICSWLCSLCSVAENDKERGGGGDSQKTQSYNCI